MSKKIAVIDGNSLMHPRLPCRARTPMTAKDGTPHQRRLRLPRHAAASSSTMACAGRGRVRLRRRPAGAFRIEGHRAQYKAQRPPMDDELHVQFPVIQELLGGHGRARRCACTGWEGDDVLGTIAAARRGAGLRDACS
ncbi:MAG: hypothetical protein ACLTDR_07585 [Adlercreutzia equolifaciens]